MKLVSQGPGHYETQDGRVKVFLDHNFETECDEPHPVRMSLAHYNGFADHYRLHVAGFGARRKGNHMCWYCPGGESHYYSMWTVEVDGDWTDDVYETFAGAVGAAERESGLTLTVSRPRKPKAATTGWTPAPSGAFPTRPSEYGGGRLVWAACGHPAERDVNDHCYTCHGELAVASAAA